MIIYIHRNLINGKVYIGQTKLSLQRRSHTDGSGYKDQNKFWNAIQKYGWENFSHAILEECSEEEADEKEKFWINFFNSTDSNFGYNCLVGGRTAKIKTLFKKGVFCKETHQYFESLSDAAEWAGLSRDSMNDITKQIEGLRISAGKHPETKEPLHWCFSQDDFNTPNKIRSSHNAVNIILINTGEIFESISQATKKTGISYPSIKKSCDSKGEITIRKNKINYNWMYLKDYSGN